MAHHASWQERAIDIVKGQPEPPPKPAAPAADQKEWHKSVEEHRVVPGLTVHDVGLSVFGETRSLHDRPGLERTDWLGPSENSSRHDQ
jgi:hypothetical protein